MNSRRASVRKHLREVSVIQTHPNILPIVPPLGSTTSNKDGLIITCGHLLLAMAKQKTGNDVTENFFSAVGRFLLPQFYIPTC